MELTEGSSGIEKDWPDPFPAKGMSNEDWAKELLANLYSADYMGFENSVKYLTRALDIACLHSVRPSDRHAEKVEEKLDQALNLLEPLGHWDFISEARNILDKVRKLRC